MVSDVAAAREKLIDGSCAYSMLSRADMQEVIQSLVSLE
jgi:hypothetical protein